MQKEQAEADEAEDDDNDEGWGLPSKCPTETGTTTMTILIEGQDDDNVDDVVLTDQGSQSEPEDEEFKEGRGRREVKRPTSTASSADNDNDNKNENEGLGHDGPNSPSGPQEGPRGRGQQEPEVEEPPGIKFCPPVYIQRYCRVTEILTKAVADAAAAEAAATTATDIVTTANGNNEANRNPDVSIVAKDDNKDKEDEHCGSPDRTTASISGVAPKTVMEVGCAEFSMHVYLSKMPGVERVIYLDLDENLLSSNTFRLQPLVVDHLRKREAPLHVEAYAGCVTKVDPKVISTPDQAGQGQPIYAVIAIEIVEHLDPPILSGFVKSVFGVISPALVLITTPNSEFNVLFNLPEGKFRHWDHRFEWTRKEFENWCAQICETYPSYSCTFEGIGEALTTAKTEGRDLGCVSQLAIFRKVNGPGPEAAQESGPAVTVASESETETDSHAGIIQENAYKLMATVDYPFFIDTTPLNERIVREFKFYLNCYILTPCRIDDYLEDELTEIKFPLGRLCSIYGLPPDVTVEQIKSALEEVGYQTHEGIDEHGETQTYVTIQVPEKNYDEDESSYEDDYDYEIGQGDGNSDGVDSAQNGTTQAQISDSKEWGIGDNEEEEW